MRETELRFELDPSLDEGFPTARARFADWLQGQHVSEDDAEELHVVLSELVANAVEATPDAPERPPIHVWAQRHGEKVWIEVSNSAQRTVRFPPMPELPADPLGPSGRGLVIVKAFTDRVAAETLDGRTRVTAVKTLRASA
jgi:anti-sigma regulatory factor (Ser/Thr protein kinase)